MVGPPTLLKNPINPTFQQLRRRYFTHRAGTVTLVNKVAT
jgi:hypothetical protein